ncbi:MAG: TylF/MycF/NovP-related O-methyltransferase [Candidatus Saccharibacteria bacterium]|nr:TylF/MycF/NovP-related O-methyltransferase [Candidatus Saccharibacteria bacterium]
MNNDPVAYARQAVLASDQVDRAELAVVLRELQRTKSVPGAVVEFGCFVGTTSVHLQRWLLGGDKELHVYDSFEGLPEKTAEDSSPAGEQFRPGELHATKKQLITNFKKADLPLPHIHRGWFSELPDDAVPPRVSFAFLDGDYYESVLTPLRLLESRLQPGAIIVVDDYANEALPGAAKAVAVWRQQTKHQTTLQVEQSLAIIRLTAS